MNGFIPMAVLEKLTEERWHDPRITAASGWSPSRKRRLLGDPIGTMLIRLGRWLEGPCPESASAPSH